MKPTIDDVELGAYHRAFFRTSYVISGAAHTVSLS